MLKSGLVHGGEKLDKLELQFNSHGLVITIDWFRIKYKTETESTFWHEHSGCEIHYVIEGSLCIETEKKVITLSKGELLMIAPNILHRLRALDSEYSVRLVVNYSITPLENKDEIHHTIAFLMSPSLKPIRVSSFCKQIIYNILYEANTQAYGFYHIIELNFLVFLYTINREFKTDLRQSCTLVKKKKSYDDLRMESIQGFIKQNIYTDLKVKDLADNEGLSISQLERITKRCKQKTPHQIIKEMRIQRARSLLYDANLSISDISDIMNFSSEYEFNRTFKRVEGMPPGKFREGILRTGK